MNAFKRGFPPFIRKLIIYPETMEKITTEIWIFSFSGSWLLTLSTRVSDVGIDTRVVANAEFISPLQLLAKIFRGYRNTNFPAVFFVWSWPDAIVVGGDPRWKHLLVDWRLVRMARTLHRLAVAFEIGKGVFDIWSWVSGAMILYGRHEWVFRVADDMTGNGLVLEVGLVVVFLGVAGIVGSLPLSPEEICLVRIILRHFFRT